MHSGFYLGMQQVMLPFLWFFHFFFSVHIPSDVWMPCCAATLLSECLLSSSRPQAFAHNLQASFAVFHCWLRMCGLLSLLHYPVWNVQCYLKAIFFFFWIHDLLNFLFLILFSITSIDHFLSNICDVLRISDWQSVIQCFWYKLDIMKSLIFFFWKFH